MLIDERGKTYGLISGGCLEENLIYHAKEVLQSGQSQIVKYDLKSENDLDWGQGAGCNGVIYIYIEEIGWNILKDRHGHSIWEGIDQKLLSGCCVASVKFIDEDHKIKSSIYYCEDGEVLCGSNCLDKSLFTYLETFVSCEKKVDFLTKEGEGRMLAELYKPKEVLYIFGAGPDTEPLVEVVSKLDFSVRVIDPRSERFDHGNFSTADQLIIEFPHVYLQHNHLHLNSFVLIMTHNFRWDQSILKHFVKKPPQYLGILGPKKANREIIVS